MTLNENKPWLDWISVQNKLPTNLIEGLPVIVIDRNRELGMAWYLGGKWDSDDKTINVNHIECWAEVPLPADF